MECPDPLVIPPEVQILGVAQASPVLCDTATMWEALTATFTVPAVGGSGIINVCNSAQYAIGARIIIENGGYYEIIGRPNAQSLTIQNNGIDGNAVPTSVIPIGNVFIQCDQPFVIPDVIFQAILAAVGTQPTVIVSDEAADVVTVTIQMRDADGNNLAEQCVLECWVSNAAAGALGTAPDGAVTATTGTIVASHTAKTHLVCITDANGALVLTLTESGALVTFFNVNVQSKYVAGSQAMTWA